MSSSMESLSLDFSKLLNGRLHTDLELQCEGQFLPVHKAILSARSEVFEAMFQADMLEARTGSVEIVDMEYLVLKEFLQYLYTGKLSSDMTVDVASRLYEASDKYAVVSLKEKCGQFLSENLTQDNACGLLASAEAHCDHQLKDNCLCYIVDNDVPLKCDEWLEFSDVHPKLANEVLYLAYKKTKCSPK